MLSSSVFATPQFPSARRHQPLNRAFYGKIRVFLFFAFPFWGIYFPVLGLSDLLSFIQQPTLANAHFAVCGIALLLASVNLAFNAFFFEIARFFFTGKGVKLPGLDFRRVPYSNIKGVYLSEAAPLIVIVDYLPLSRKLTQQSGSTCSRWFITNSPEEAKQVFSLFAKHCLPEVMHEHPSHLPKPDDMSFPTKLHHGLFQVF